MFFRSSAKSFALAFFFSSLTVLADAPQAQATTQIFPVEPSISVPSVVNLNFTSGDFNGDGRADTLMVVGQGTPSLLVLLSQQNAAPTQVLTSLSSLPSACSSSSIAAADVNHDQKLDVVLACATFVSVFLGNGDATFQAPILSTFPTVTSPFVLSDVNGDGLPDLVYVSSLTQFAVSLNQSGGHFGAPGTNMLTGLTLTSTIAAGDFNGDSKQDFFFTTRNGVGAYVLGNGDGTFQTAQSLPPNFGAFAIADFNHDGFADVAYSTAISPDEPPFNSNLIVLPGSSSGLASTGQTIPTNGSDVVFLAAVDLTGSGNVDLVQGNEGQDSPSNTLVFLNDGKGNFSPPVSYAAQSVIGLADLNGDGFPDLVGATLNATSLPFAAGKGDGTFQALPNTPNGQSSQTFAVADMNGDGLPDAVLQDQNGAPSVFLSRGDGRFTPVPNTGLPAAPGFRVAADFNGDGKADIASITPGQTTLPISSAAVAVFLGNGDGTLNPVQPAQSLAPRQISAAVAGDFNGDKKQDLIVISSADPYGAFLLLGNGDGTFQAAQPIALLSTALVAIAAADLNNDGILDLVVSDQYLGTTAYLGKGDGTFQPVSGTLPFVPNSIIVADVNGDGKPDLTVFALPFNAPQDELAVFIGNGDGTFSANPSFTQTYSGNVLISLGDLNGDGLPDIVVNAGQVFLNQGGGSFAPDTTAYLGGSGPIIMPAVLERLNSNHPSSGASQTLDALVYASGGLTSLLNQLNPAPKTVPTLNVSLANGVTSITSGAAVTIDAALYGVGATAPTGTVAFFAGSTQIGTANITDAQASITGPVSGSGQVLIRAVYQGDTTYGAATGYATLAITAPAATTTTLSASPTNANEQQQVTLTATVQGNAPSGTITFLNGSTTLGTATLLGGTASFNSSFAAAGSVSITASYSGDVNNLASTSSPAVITIVAPSFSIAASPASATVTAGQSATFTITVTPAGGFSSAVSLSCGTLPVQTTCSFSSSSVTPGNGQPAQITLTVSTTAASAQLHPADPGMPRERPELPSTALASLAALVGLATKNRFARRWNLKLKTLSLLCFVAGLGLSLTGCGGGGSHTPAVPGTPAGTSSIAITASATGGGSPQAANIQLTVQ